MFGLEKTCRFFRVANTVGAVTGIIVFAGIATAAGDYPFSGRWRMDTTSITGAKPTVFQVRDGLFQRNGAKAIKADGLPHPVTDSGYVDEQIITIESDNLVRETDKIRGRLAYVVDYEISRGGNILTSKVANYTNPDGKPVYTETAERRIGAAVKGAHLLSGRWKRINITVDPKSDWILRLDGNRFSWRKEGGAGYDAIIGGPPVPLDGDNSGVRAQVTRPQPDLIVETDFATNGTIDDTLSMRLMPDGKTITASGIYASGKGKTTFILRRVAD